MSSDEHQKPRVVSVSRDALRADLAEMELRLRVYFDAALGHKANAADLAALQSRVGDLELSAQTRDRGEFTPAQKRAITEQVDECLDGRSDRSWTHRERLGTVLSAVTAIGMFALAVLAALHGVSL